MDTRHPNSRLIGLSLTALLLFGLSGPAAAKCLEPTSERPTIGLVLGGGGARGSAHIGVIRVLEELNIPVDCIAGTSIGSLVAALYATGMNAAELEEVMLGLDWDDLFVDDTQREDQPFRRKRDDNLALYGPKLGIGKDAALIKSGVISGQKISFIFESLVKERVQVEHFDDLPIPYRAVAADIATGDEVVLSSGDLALAMRASMSVPGVFNPVDWDGHMLVDGGIVNNVPADVVRDMGADVLIVVDVGSGLLKKDELDSAVSIIAQMTNILIQKNADEQIAALTGDDIVIRPPLGDEVGSADFPKTAAGIEIGYKAADEMRAQLATLGIPADSYTGHRKDIASRITPSPIIDFVQLDNQSRFDDSVLLERLSIREGEALDVASLDKDIREIYALGFMDLVRYEIVSQGDETGIVVHAGQDSRGTQMLEWGVDFFSDENNNAVNLRVGYLNTGLDRFGSELRIVTQLGEDPALWGYLYKYVDPALKVYLEPQIFAERQVLTIYDDRGNALQTNEVTQYGGEMSIGRELGRSAAIAMGVRAYTGDIEVRTGPSDQPSYEYDGGEYFFAASFDRIDDRYFPRSGLFFGGAYNISDDSLGADEEFEQIKIEILGASTFGNHSLLAGAHYNSTTDGDAPIYAQFRAGGFGRLSGYHPNELVGPNFAMAIGGYRYHFAGSGLLPAYVGMTMEYGNVAEERGDLFDDALFSGSAYFGYRSPIGPLYLGLGAAEGGRRLYFLRVGNVFGGSSISR